MQKKLSLISAILININIMLGSGIFINTTALTALSGSLGALDYIIVGILLLPLILAISELVKYYQDNSTFYNFGLSISPFFGFLSSWSYFVGKLCSCALALHVCINFLQQIIPALQVIPTILFDIIVVWLFTYLNLLNLQTGKRIQYSFIFLKLIPILFTIFAGIYLFSGSNFNGDSAIWSGIPLSIPLVIYAFSGFEASCSLSRHIENPEKNGPKAILISFAIVIFLISSFQFIFYGNLGLLLGKLQYTGAYPALIEKMWVDHLWFKELLIKLMHIGIAASSLGASYGIMYSNIWNLYTLAQANHTFQKNLLMKVNGHGIPTACVVIEGLLITTYLLLTSGSQLPLQQVGALGATIAYTFSAIGLIVLLYNKHKKITFVAIAGVLSCLIMISTFVWGIVTKGLSTLLLLFIIILIAGTAMFFSKHEKSGGDEVFEEI